MKKFFVLILTLLIILSCGCSCSSLNTLSFKTFWNENKPSSTISKETLYYTVKLDKSYNYNDYSCNKSDFSSYNFEEYDFTEGSLVLTTEVISLPNDNVKNKESDILVKYDVQYVLKLTSKFEILPSYSKSEEKDFVYSECYVLDNDAKTPIYSYTKSKASYPVLDKEKEYTVEILEQENEIIYNTEDYEIKDIKNSKTEKYNYNASTIIDNEQLLFTIRNISFVDENSYKYLPTVSPSYGIYKNLLATYVDNTNIEGIPCTSVRVQLANESMGCGCISTNLGKAQLVFLQNNACEIKGTPVNNRTLIVRYVEPISASNTLLCFGALVYTLDNVTIE